MTRPTPHTIAVLARTFIVAALLPVQVVAAPAVAPASAAPAPRHHETPVLRVEVTGTGTPMVFLPGLTVSGDVWRDAVAHYSGTHECHVVTLGGFAGRPRYEGPFLDTARDSLLGYIRAHHLRQPVLVGHSLGGVLALELAVAAPDAIGPLVIVDALPFLGGAADTTATPESARQAMEPMWKALRGQTQEAYAAYQRQAPYLRSMVAPGPNYDRVVEWAATSDPIAVADAMLDVQSRDLRGLLPGLRSPMLVLASWYGTRAFSTREATEATFRRQYARAPRWTLAIADTARHFIMLDAPEWTFARIDSFFASAGSHDRSHARPE